MAKNRKTHNNPPYTTKEGHIVNDNSHNLEFYEGLSKKIEDWVELSFGTTPDDYLSSEELEFIQEQMTSSEKVLTRVEEAERNWISEEVDEMGWIEEVHPQVGDTFNFNGKLKAFSKTMTATKDFMRRYMKDRNELVIYRLPKGTQQFDVQKWDNYHEEEKESWVNSKNYRVTNIENISKQFNHKIVTLVDLEPIG